MKKNCIKKKSLKNERLHTFCCMYMLSEYVQCLNVSQQVLILIHLQILWSEKQTLLGTNLQL